MSSRNKGDFTKLLLFIILSHLNNFTEFHLIIEEKKFRNIKHVLINVGVNDIDHKTAEEVFHQLQIVVNLLREKDNNPKIIISEVTPRIDEKDEEVKKCNDLIDAYASSYDYIFLAKQSNLRSEDNHMFSDTKHITRYATPVFVSNIKKTLREAYGLPPNPKAYGNKNIRNYRSSGNIAYGYNRRSADSFDLKTELENFKNEIRNSLTTFPTSEKIDV